MSKSKSSHIDALVQQAIDHANSSEVLTPYKYRKAKLWLYEQTEFLSPEEYDEFIKKLSDKLGV